MQRRRGLPRPLPSLAAPLFALLLAILAIAAPSAGFAQAPNVSATLDDGVPAGTYKQNGDTLTYTTVITNSGAVNATGVTLTEPTPADTTLVPGSVHASPLANDDSYTAVGNTKLYVGVAAPAGEPALELPAGQALFANEHEHHRHDRLCFSYKPGQRLSYREHGRHVRLYAELGFTGIDSFTYTLQNNADTSLTDTGTVSITVSNLVWYVNNAAAAGNGTSASPFNSLASVNGAGGVGDSDGANDFIYVYRGSGAYTGGLPLESGQTLMSESNALVVGGLHCAPRSRPPTSRRCRTTPPRPWRSRPTTRSTASSSPTSPATASAARLSARPRLPTSR